MVNKARLSRKTNSRDLESEMMVGVYTSDVVASKAANESPFQLPPTKRQRTSSYIPDNFVPLSLKKEQNLEDAENKLENDSDDELLILTSSPLQSSNDSQKLVTDSINSNQVSESKGSKSPSTSVSQPTDEKNLSNRSLGYSSQTKDQQLKQSSKSHQTSKAATQPRGGPLIWSTESGKSNTECQTTDSKKMGHSENLSVFNDDQGQVNDFNSAETLNNKLEQKQVINQKQSNKIHSKKAKLKTLQKSTAQSQKNKKQNRVSNLASNPNAHGFLLLLKALDLVEYECWKEETIRNSELFMGKFQQHSGEEMSDESASKSRVMSQDSSDQDQLMKDQDESHAHNHTMPPQSMLDDSQMICPITINPNNPIKDPITKKRIRMCANRFCCNPNKNPTDYKGWSRRKLNKSGQFMWLCDLCSQAFKNNQYCTACYQIYLDSGDYAETDGKEWVQCENCNKWEHTDCEVINGFTELPEKLQQDGWKYFCPLCRKKKPLIQSTEVSSNDPNETKISLIESIPVFSADQLNQDQIEPNKIDFDSKDFDKILSDLTSTQKQANNSSTKRISRQKQPNLQTDLDSIKSDSLKKGSLKTRSSNQERLNHGTKSLNKVDLSSALESHFQENSKSSSTPTHQTNSEKQTDSFAQVIARSQMTTRHGKASVTASKKL
eukprot:403344053